MADDIDTLAAKNNGTNTFNYILATLATMEGKTILEAL
jgi:hypothetical protein